MQLGARFGRVLHAAALRKALDQRLDQGGELFEIAAAAAFRFAGETRHALRHEGGDSDALLLAVIADIDPGLGLLLDHVADGAVHFLSEPGRVDGISFFTANQKVGEDFIARKAADVSGKNAIAAGDHGEYQYG